jgi:hypothetical protein
MQYNYFYRYTDTGVEYIEFKMSRWYHLNVCPECGTKIPESINDIIVPHEYICDRCYQISERYRRVVDKEPNLRYARSVLQHRIGG